jgi:chromosome segregation protein
MAQVDLLLKEAEKLYISRKGQLEKVLKHRELSAEKERLEVELQLSYVQSLTKLKNFRQEELDKLIDEQKSIDSFLDSARSGLDQQQNQLEEFRNQKENLSGKRRELEERLNSFDVTIGVYNERFHEISQRSKDAKSRAQQVQDRMELDKQKLEERNADYESILENIRLTQDSIEKLSEEIEKLKADKIRHQLDIDDLDKDNEEIAQNRVSITAQISDLANDIADNLEKHIKGSGYSSAVRAKAEKELLSGITKARNIILEKIDFLRDICGVDFERKVFQDAIEQTEESLLEQIDEVKGLFQEYSGTIPTFLDDFTSPEGTLAKKSQLDKDLNASYEKENANKAKAAELSGEIERLSRLIMLKESDLNDLNLDHVQFKTKADSIRETINNLKNSIQQMEFDYSDAYHSVEAEESKVNEVLENIDSLKERKTQTQDEIEDLKIQLSEVTDRIDEISQEISQNNSQFQERFSRKQTIAVDIATATENIRAIQENIQKIFTDFFENTQKSLKEFNDHEITATDEELKSKLDTVKRKLQDLGYINYMAEDEYNEAKKNYDFYSKNMSDLSKAKADLEEVIAEIRRRSEEMFMETYGQISQNFQEMFTTLFGGGKAELMLTDEENILESGIDIKAQPPGKKMLQLNLLSGGERSMTAVALLFATYMVKPSPFCILDEIDAALDTRNIGAFMRVLDKFEDESQFIIITHNKGTVMGSDCLLGVTQQEPGVSKMIGYKIEDIENLDEHDTLKG